MAHARHIALRRLPPRESEANTIEAARTRRTSTAARPFAQSARRMTRGVFLPIQTTTLLKHRTQRGEYEDLRSHAGTQRIPV